MSGKAILFCKTASLTIAYEVHGPETGVPVILLHGFPIPLALTTRSRRSSPLRVTESSFRTCAVTGRLASTMQKHCAQASKPHSLRICWI